MLYLDINISTNLHGKNGPSLNIHSKSPSPVNIIVASSPLVETDAVAINNVHVRITIFQLVCLPVSMVNSRDRESMTA